MPAPDFAASELFSELQKTGAFISGARDIISDFDSGKIDAKQRTQKLQLLQDSIDNRFGQLVYDNLFWNKTLKDLLVLSTRSVGWNFGTLRELGGGLLDFAKYPKQLVSGKGTEFTDRMAYTIALPAVVALEGATAMYMMTGKRPDELKDYFFPKTGKTNKDGTEERLSLPSYMKDVAAYSIQPSTTIAHKLHPMWGAMYQMMNNEDYYGANISDADKMSPEWMKDYATYAAKQFVPFSVSGYLQRKQSGEGTLPSAEAFAGVNPAPRYIDRTPAESMMSKIIKSRLPESSTKQESDKRTVRNSFLNKIDDGSVSKADFELAQKVGLLDENGDPEEGFKRVLNSTPQARTFSMLRPVEALQSWNLMRAYEKPLYAEIFARKISDATAESLGITEDEQDKLIDSAYAIADKAPEKPDMLSKFEDLRDKVMEGVGK
jgi:hypothetical protein